MLFWGTSKWSVKEAMLALSLGLAGLSSQDGAGGVGCIRTSKIALHLSLMQNVRAPGHVQITPRCRGALFESPRSHRSAASAPPIVSNPENRGERTSTGSCAMQSGTFRASCWCSSTFLDCPKSKAVTGHRKPTAACSSEHEPHRTSLARSPLGLLPAGTFWAPGVWGKCTLAT